MAEAFKSVRRVCWCGNWIPSIRVRALFCSSLCRDEFKRQEKRKKKLALELEARKSKIVLCHSCLANPLDPEKECFCRKWIDESEAKRMIDENEAVDFESRKAIFAGRSILIIGLKKMVARGATIESAHVERGLGIVKSYRRNKSFTLDYETARRHAQEARVRDQQDRAAEERVRWDSWRDLAIDFMQSLTVDVPEEEWIEARDAAEGRPGIFVTTEERTSLGRTLGSRVAEESFDFEREETEVPEVEASESDDRYDSEADSENEEREHEEQEEFNEEAA